MEPIDTRGHVSSQVSPMVAVVIGWEGLGLECVSFLETFQGGPPPNDVLWYVFELPIIRIVMLL